MSRPALSYDLQVYRSTREAAELLSVSPKTVQLWVESGVLQAWKTAGGHRRVTMESIQAILRQRGQVAGQQPPAVAPRPRMLVVEDEANLRRLYEFQVASWKLPLDLATASDGFEALVRLGEQSPDILVTDLRMPGMDGFRMLRRLRELKLDVGMLVIAVTALDAGEIEVYGGLPPGVRVFAKPVPFERLRRLVEERIGCPAAA
ncbi:hypothetical protein GCM10027399_09420 [Curvibacter fontanus]|jgi:excisionase family DNA binding protein